MLEFKSSVEIVVTLYEGHYSFGVAALINSLYNAEFKGLVRIGYRGDLPTWINQLDRIAELDYKLDNKIFISFVKVNTDFHFGYYKPFFIKDTVKHYPTASKVFYFDPDIIITAKWNFISNWTNLGVSLCLDNCFPFVHENHPWRNEWIKFSGINESERNYINYYVNSGYIGLNRNRVGLIDKWIELTNKYHIEGGNIKLFEKNGGRAFKGDQDLLNAAITISPEIQFSIIGTEGMGFTQPAFLMIHAVSPLKPWKKNFCLNLLKNGKKPSDADKKFFENVNFPISVFNKNKYLIKIINLKISTVFGRFIG